MQNWDCGGCTECCREYQVFVTAEEKARIENSVIWAHTRVGANAQIVNAIIGRGCHIGRSASVGAGTVLGDKASLTDYSQTGGVATT